MKVLVLVITLCVFVTATSITTRFLPQSIFSSEVWGCQVSENVVDDYQHAVYQFTVDAYKNVGSKGVNHFVFSPLSLWIILSAIAEAADPITKQAMFQVLRLPFDPCIRLKYYELATSRFSISPDVYVSSTRSLIVDEAVKINPAYYNFISKHSLLDIVSAPIRRDPWLTLEEMRRISRASIPNMDLSGNSAILDAVDYNGLWSSAFEDAIVERSPFYSRTGEHIGFVDMMKVRTRVRRTYLRSINVKTIELPVGYNGRYRMIIGLVLDHNVPRALNNFKDTVIDEYLGSIEETLEPIDIAIPRLTITAEYDLRKILEELEVKKLWADPAVTRSISDPPALPSGFVQRSTITLDTPGLEPAPSNHQSSCNSSTTWDPVVGREFVANRPFILALFDAETYTCVMAAAFTQPTYKN